MKWFLMLASAAAVGVFVLLVVLAPVKWPNQWLLLWHLPAGWGALFGALFGLAAVAWAAKTGFQNSLAAQQEQHRNELERLERNHAHERRVLAASLAAELDCIGALTSILVRTAADRKLLVENLEKTSSTYEFDIEMYPRAPPLIFTANISRLGILGPVDKKVDA